jgi:hypothetical protein
MMAKTLKEREASLFRELEEANAKHNHDQVEVEAQADAKELRADIVDYLAGREGAHVRVGEDCRTVEIKIGKKSLAVTAMGDGHWKIPHDDATHDEMLKAVLKFMRREFGWAGNIAH